MLIINYNICIYNAFYYISVITQRMGGGQYDYMHIIMLRCLAQNAQLLTSYRSYVPPAQYLAKMLASKLLCLVHIYALHYISKLLLTHTKLYVRAHTYK